MEISLKMKMRQWERTQTANESERQRIAFLKGPLPQNPPEIMKPTRCKVLKPTFCIKGKRVELDTILTMPLHEAISLEALRKVMILERE